MDKLAAIAVFHAIAEHGTLTAASLRNGKSLPTVVRTLAQLESELGVRLFNRTTRRIDLTEEGALYLAETTRLLSDLDAAEARISGRENRLTGHVAISAPVFFGERFVAPLLKTVTDEHPGLSLRLHLSDRVEDMVQGHIDMAVRIGHLPSSELVRQKIGEVRQVLCASPGQIAQAGRPARPADLSSRDCVIIDGNTSGRQWPFRTPDGRREVIDVGGGVTVTTMRAARAACLAGSGFGLFLSYQVARDIRQDALARLLADYEPLPQPVQLVHAAGSMPALRIRTIWSILERRLTQTLREEALPAVQRGGTWLP